MAGETYTVTYTGSAPFASMLVQMLEDEGVSVRWQRPREDRGGGDVARDIVLSLVASGAYDSIKATIARFRAKAKGRGDAKIQDDPK